MKFQHIEFITTVMKSAQLLALPHLPEIAVVGRSNVGKSSLLNHLFNKELVKTSSIPGKTRALNFFQVDRRYFFVDMPGYGYAAVSKEEQKNWQELIEGYLSNRQTLKMLLLLLDFRREPSAEDMRMVEWISHYRIPTILVMTKVDKIGKSKRLAQSRRITDRIKGLPYVHYSTTKNEGRRELIASIREGLERDIN